MPLPEPRPHFLCIGTAKAGTTWFHQMFPQHPDVWMSLLKETHYFDGLHGDAVRLQKGGIRRRIGQRAQMAYDRNGPLAPNTLYWEDLRTGIWTPEWYARAFTHPNARAKTLGEATPAYCALPIEGIKTIWNDLPGVRLIHFIRDPVGRTLSTLRMSATAQGFAPDDPPPEDFWHEQLEIPGTFARGDYAAQIPRWLSVFPADRILYLPFGEIKTDPLGVLRRIERHLDLPAARYDIDRISRQVHAGARFRIPPSVRERLDDMLSPQWAFLMDHFPDEFCKRL